MCVLCIFLLFVENHNNTRTYIDTYWLALLIFIQLLSDWKIFTPFFFCARIVYRAIIFLWFYFYFMLCVCVCVLTIFILFCLYAFAINVFTCECVYKTLMWYYWSCCFAAAVADFLLCVLYYYFIYIFLCTKNKIFIITLSFFCFVLWKYILLLLSGIKFSFVCIITRTNTLYTYTYARKICTYRHCIYLTIKLWVWIKYWITYSTLYHFIIINLFIYTKHTPL